MTYDNMMKLQVVCPQCHTIGVTKVTHTTYIKAPDRTLTRRLHKCTKCNAKYWTIDYQAPTLAKNSDDMLEQVRKAVDEDPKLHMTQCIDITPKKLSDEEVISAFAKWTGEKVDDKSLVKKLNSNTIFEEVTMDDF